jgi:hypothetical protein
MRKTILYCKSGKSPSLCGGDCNSCFSQAVYTADFCDKCGVELIYDDEKTICRNCMNNNIKKSKSKSERNDATWESRL